MCEFVHVRIYYLVFESQLDLWWYSRLNAVKIICKSVVKSDTQNAINTSVVASQSGCDRWPKLKKHKSRRWIWGIQEMDEHILNLRWTISLSLSAQSNTFTFSAAFFFSCAQKSSLWTLFSALVLVSSLLSFLISLTLSPSLALPPSWVRLLLHPPPLSLWLNIFLQGKHFHLRYGWLFNAVSPSELEEAWCSACFLWCANRPCPPQKINAHSLTPCCTTPI